MSVLGWIGIVYGIIALMAIGILLYDYYLCPFCPQCGDNLKTKRIKDKKVICRIHGEFTRE